MAGDRDSREIVRTLKLRKPIHYAGESLEVLEFVEPDAGMMIGLERVRDDNAALASGVKAKGRKWTSPTAYMVEYCTGVDTSSLATMAFADFNAATEIVADLTGVEIDDDDQGDGELDEAD